MQKIRTFLWFDNQAEEAANFYASLFKNSKIQGISRREGRVLTVEFELDGQQYIALNGGPGFPFTQAISLFVDCEDQKEVDELWTKMTGGGGSEIQCGWLKDKYGLSWQIIPKVLLQMLRDPDPRKSQAVFQAMLKMKKIVVADLQRAYETESAA